MDDQTDKMLLRIMSMLEELILQQGNDIIEVNKRLLLVEKTLIDMKKLNYSYKDVVTYNDEVF